MAITPTIRKLPNAFAIGTEQVVWTPAAGLRWRLGGFSVSLSAAASIVFREGIGGPVVWRTPQLPANTPYDFAMPGDGLPATEPDVPLTAQASAAANATGTVYGLDEAMP